MGPGDWAGHAEFPKDVGCLVGVAVDGEDLWMEGMGEYR